MSMTFLEMIRMVWQIIKQIGWALLAFLIIGQISIIVSLLFHPVGGGEMHQIFSYWSGGRLDVAMRVFAEYVITSGVLAGVLIFFRYPGHWSIPILMASAVAVMRWLKICCFPYQTHNFYIISSVLIFTIPIFMFLISFPALVLRRKFDAPDDHHEGRALFCANDNNKEP